MASHTGNGRLSADEVKRQAAGRWPDILQRVCGLSDSQLNPKQHGPCPRCGGTDRFRALDDVAETGGLYCNQCFSTGNGDGLAAVQWLRDCTFAEALRLVAAELGHSRERKPSVRVVKPKTVHPTAERAAEALAWSLAQAGSLPAQRPPDAAWRYRHADGSDAGSVLRWDLPDGRKEIRQVSAIAGGWLTTAMAEPRPLFRLPEIIDANEVWICEGEKSADAAGFLGMTATTSAGGSGAAEKSDWRPLAGKRVYILPDHDEPGRKYAAAVCRLIQQQAPTATVEVKLLADDWRGIPEGGDLFDWQEHFDSQDAETLVQRLQALPDRAAEFVESSASVDVDGLHAGIHAPFVDNECDFRPFPVHELPEPLATFCDEVAAAVGCDSSFPALASLAVCSAAIGTSRQICLKRGWFAPAVLWTLLVGESGTQKSPPFRLAMAPLKERQRRDAERFAAENAEYQSALREYRRQVKRFERSGGGGGDEPEPPVQPMRSRCVVQDATIEALAPILNENPRGVLLSRDELSGWLAGFDRYSAGKSGASAEAPKWLEIYNVEAITIDRKTGDQRFVYVRRPFVSITGGIQPGILARCLTNEHRDNGLQSRLLMTYPPRQPKQWRDDEVSSATQAAYADLIRDLFELQHDATDGDLRPATLTLSDEARELFKRYVNETGQEQAEFYGHLASQWSKLEETPARLAIVLHCARQVSTGVVDPWQIDGETMRAAIILAEWFKGETLRINRLLSEPEESREARHLADWIRSHGGRITARDLCRLRRDIATTDEAELKLMRLVEARQGSWHGIHKSREFVLSEQGLSTNGA